MKLHEFQAKAVLAQSGIPIPAGIPLLKKEDLPTVLKKLPAGPWVVKAQVHTGGRGKAGGILKAQTPQDIEAVSATLFGKKLVTHQTGPEGVIIRKLYIEQAQSVKKELYLACVMDRSKNCPVIVASTEGGMDIEELAKSRPEALHYQAVDPNSGLGTDAAQALAKKMGLPASEQSAVAEVMSAVAKAFLAWDASLLEINPLGVTADGKVVAMDAKMSLDDNALFRHKEALSWRDPLEENPLDVRAQEAGVNYIALDGSIGCLVNGAGLAMATMDLIKFHGGSPANFLDVGGGANAKQVTEAFKIILSDKKVKGILVNIFGGIMKCDVIADGIVTAAKEVGMPLPLVVRLEGTNVEKGRQILKESGLKLEPAKDLTEAAEKIVAATR